MKGKRLRLVANLSREGLTGGVCWTLAIDELISEGTQ